MKKRFSIILYLLLCSVTLFAEKTTNEDFWVRLDYMIRGTVPFKYEKESAEIELTKWDSKVWVSIQGNYTIADSLELDKAMKNFGEMLPQLGINWAGKSDPSLVVVFSGLPEIYSIQKYNLFKYSVPRNRILLNHRFKIKNTSDGILIVNDTISGNNRLNTIWSSFGKILVEYNGYGYNSGTESVLGGKIRKLTDFDRFFFSTIYADSFTDQYLQFIKGRYNLTDQFLPGSKFQACCFLHLRFLHQLSCSFRTF